MEVEAIYEKGGLRLLRPVPFRREGQRVTVTVPDEALEGGQQDAPPVQDQDLLANLDPAIIRGAEELRARMDAILRAPLPPEDELPPLSPKHEERMQAMELRAQYRREQGRPE